MHHQLYRQLTREILANRGKAAFLGMAILVAVYYWIPALGSLFSAENRPATASLDPPSVAAVAAEAGPPAATAATPAANTDWDELMNRIANDPRMRSAAMPDGRPDPFAPLDAMAQPGRMGSEKGQQEAVVTAGQVTPENLGMTLTGTLVGPRVTVVKISGRTYSFPSDETMPASRSRRKLRYQLDQGDFEFEIVSARPGCLVLARGGEEYELSVRLPTFGDHEGIHFLTGSH
ncbi:MAG: hypothetical protein GTO53_14075 [Planctomycetales bacterium]|nr:hypothetical protein [Planctomycetales bacterium]NIM10215.1 hypothetical protein [Planctomycetales bacterium]NIN09631.1 hypothetical protein [Planctomycetales bacterium]NIN78687.1 hypothetical protein [Planctomycetales bacterium]NIO35932.1 hypothetical protein [Planctomycetales bacterium]